MRAKRLPTKRSSAYAVVDMFSSRIQSCAKTNRLAQVRADLGARGVAVIDLMESNPTRVGFKYPARLLDAFTGDVLLSYQPTPRGLAPARSAVAQHLGTEQHSIDPERILLTASTSEAYAMLFKLLCDPGDQILVPQPSYPLLEHLTRLEGVESVGYPLVYHERWEVDTDALYARVTERTRAVVVVSPNNPTGSVLLPHELERIQTICRHAGCALISDEVFGGYIFDQSELPRSVLHSQTDVLTFCLGGLSKAVGLPQVKLGWIVVSGVDSKVHSALDALDLILDTYLSVSTPIQVAAPLLMEQGKQVSTWIKERVGANFKALKNVMLHYPSATLLPLEGGWYGVVQVPAVSSEEQLVLELLERDHIHVHPGYFYDFPREAFLVMSLLLEPVCFESAVVRMLDRAAGPRGVA